MPSNLYYFDPCVAGVNVGKMGKSYRLIPIARNGGKLPDWEVPAVLVVDAAEDDLLRVQKSGPKSDGWRIVCLLDGEANLPAKLKSLIFAVLPREAPHLTLAKTIEKAFEEIEAQEEH